MPKTLELLAPAKDLQTGIAAITHGADAVYIAAEKFGAREKAGNSLTDIAKLVEFAHQYFARVYVTVNTIIYENELDEAKKLVESLYAINVDAIIVQDFAILAMDIPPIAIHASTQMHNSSPEKITFLEQCGVERVVLPRELSLKEIRLFRKQTTCELEFFIHGALCVCYSGQCYLSQAITGRSANRGACAQPCRSSYDLIDADGAVLVKNKHLLSLKDLNLSQHIDALIYNGVSSFKIEGRMKDAAYVKNTTAFYSTLINQAISENQHYKRLSSGKCNYNFSPDLERSFNRGFSQHFINGRVKGQASYNSPKSIGKQVGKVVAVGKDWFTINSGENINNGDGLCFFNSKGELNGFLVNRSNQGKIYLNQAQDELIAGTIVYRNSDHQFEKLLSGNSATRLIAVSIIVEQVNNLFVFTVIDEDSITSTLAINDTFDIATNPKLAVSSLTGQLGKAGGTIFTIATVETTIPYPKHIPISNLNAIRRELLECHRNARIQSYKTNKRLPQRQATNYPLPEADYRCNTANALSKKFLSSHGVNIIADAFEVNQPKYAVELMIARYCIKYELSLCPTKQGAKPTKPLFLRNSNFIFPLIFDCKNCQMKVMSPNKILK